MVLLVSLVLRGVPEAGDSDWIERLKQV